MNRADPCPACHALLVRSASAPAPTTCPRCGSPLWPIDPRTGRWARRSFACAVTIGYARVTEEADRE